MSVGSSSKFTAKEGNLSIFSCLRSRKFTVPAGKQNNNCKDQWICFCSRSSGGRPVTVPEWRSTHSKESTTSVAKTTVFFLLCFKSSFPLKTYGSSSLHTFPRQGSISNRIKDEHSRKQIYHRLPLKTTTSHSDPFQDKGGRISGSTSRIMDNYSSVHACTLQNFIDFHLKMGDKKKIYVLLPYRPKI